MIKNSRLKAGLLAAAIALAMFTPLQVLGFDDDPPSQAARLSYAQGSVSFQPGSTDDWVTAVINRPMTTSDKLWSDVDGRAEMQMDGSSIRISNNTGISLLNLSDNVTQVQLSTGTILIRVRRLDDSETYEIDTPNLAFSILRPGLYRLSVDEAGNTTVIKVRSGEGEVTGGGTAYTIHANEYDSFTGTDQLEANQQPYQNDQDQFEAWSENRDAHWDRSPSARYVSQDVVGYQDLDGNGDWRQSPEYGNVWFPRAATPGWAPYHYGHWAYIQPWGYTWVDDEPWGFAPFHYGRWISVGGAWGWIPAPPQPQGAQYVRPIYAPALVAWVGGGEGGSGVAWFPLGPREVYVPSYPVSRNYVNNVNVSNTTVNTTVVNNYYNTTIINKNVTVNNVKYVNQTVPGAVAATTSQAFTTSQPVARNAVKIDEHAMASTPVRAFTPAIVPVRQSVIGAGPVATAKPPVAVQTRAVVAKVAPPPPPPAFEKRQEAIKANGGRSLSTAQVRQIEPAAAQRPSLVKIAPPVKTQSAQQSRPPNVPLAANKPAPEQPIRSNQPAPPATKIAEPPAQGANHASGRPTTPSTGTAPKPPEQPMRSSQPAPPATKIAEPPAQGANRPSDRPTIPNAVTTQKPPTSPAPQTHNQPTDPKRPVEPVAASRPAAPPVHPADLPPHAAVPPPNTGNPKLDQKYQQQQQALIAKQEQQHQALQQKQDQEHQRLARTQADEAAAKQLEEKHQQQTTQMEQKHTQQQQKLQNKQQPSGQKPPPTAPNDNKSPRPY